VARLLRVLADLDAVARNDPRRLRPNETHMLGPTLSSGHHKPRTRLIAWHRSLSDDLGLHILESAHRV
jgi:hypothetical protein